jgi:hypothetical protein
MNKYDKLSLEKEKWESDKAKYEEQIKAQTSMVKLSLGGNHSVKVSNQSLLKVHDSDLADLLSGKAKIPQKTYSDTRINLN